MACPHKSLDCQIVSGAKQAKVKIRPHGDTAA